MFAWLRKAARLAPVGLFALLQGNQKRPLVFVDIGARGGLAKPWKVMRKLGLIVPVFVEPDAAAAESIRRSDPRAQILRAALGASDYAEETLHIAADPGKTSVLVPDRKNPFYDQTWETVAEVKVMIRRLDAVWDRSWGSPDFVKIDVQGYEMQVLDGMGSLLDECSCVELECTFIAFYIGQPVFQTVHDYMRNKGFGLVKIRPLGLYDKTSIVEFNAFFVRTSLHENAHVKLWKAVNDVGEQERILNYGY